MKWKLGSMPTLVVGNRLARRFPQTAASSPPAAVIPPTRTVLMLDHFDHRADRHRPLLLVLTALRILAGATCVAPQHSGKFSIGAALD